MPDEANDGEGWVSGMAALGYRIGEEIIWDAPKGRRRLMGAVSSIRRRRPRAGEERSA
jgi:hypothetical protein